MMGHRARQTHLRIDSIWIVEPPTVRSKRNIAFGIGLIGLNIRWPGFPKVKFDSSAALGGAKIAFNHVLDRTIAFWNMHVFFYPKTSNNQWGRRKRNYIRTDESGAEVNSRHRCCRARIKTQNHLLPLSGGKRWRILFVPPCVNPALPVKTAIYGDYATSAPCSGAGKRSTGQKSVISMQKYESISREFSKFGPDFYAPRELVLTTKRSKHWRKGVVGWRDRRKYQTLYTVQVTAWSHSVNRFGCLRKREVFYALWLEECGQNHCQKQVHCWGWCGVRLTSLSREE